MRRFAAMTVMLLCLAARWTAVAPTPVAAADIPFRAVQFNICSKYCTDDLAVSGASNTDYGLNPIAELKRMIAVKGLPLIISLNEVCSPALFSLAQSLDTSDYALSFVVVKHVGGTCGEYGNVLAVRTLGGTFPHEPGFQFWYGHTGPPPSGSTEEWRGGVCSRSAYLEYFGGCSSHLVLEGHEADGYRAGVDAWFPNQARIALGDFNQTPDTADMRQWRAGYGDADVSSKITYETRSKHIDYAWFGGPRPGDHRAGVAYTSSSDHHLLLATIH